MMNICVCVRMEHRMISNSVENRKTRIEKGGDLGTTIDWQ